MTKETFNAYILEDANNILSQMQQIRKWITLEHDVRYCQYRFIKISEKLARIEHSLKCLPINIDWIVAAREMNPDLMDYFNADALTTAWDKERCEKALEKLDTYLIMHLDKLSKPIIDIFKKYKKNIIMMQDIGKYFGSLTVFLYHLCKFLAEHGIFTLVTMPSKLTKKSKVELEEVALYYTD
jgi:hypothetical protein